LSNFDAIGSAFPETERYEPLEVLGRGAMGVVYRARDLETDREVALKAVLTEDANTLFALKREFRSLADVAHRNLVQLYDLTIEDGASFFTLEWIDGSDFAARYAGSRSWAEIRDAFTQLLDGLGALHAAGKLHRDVKPGNVMVESSGRIVLLDFGLAIGVDHTLSVASQREGLAGTMGYMAPEQVWGQPIGTPADLYSVGVVLYACLTGRLPFEGSALGSFLARRGRDPLVPSTLDASIPSDLSALAVDLLAYDPGDRPDIDECRRRLGGDDVPGTNIGRMVGDPFVDRSDELAALHGDFDRVRRGETRAAVVEGTSGMGKSALLERFTIGAERDHGALVLRSRCHPQQSVRFEAIDGLVDDLSRFLQQEGERADAYLPSRVRPLLRVFPVLARAGLSVPGEAQISEADPQEVRRRAFSALRELLHRVAVRRPLVLWIDDVQWGDADSAPFLLELIDGPEAPPLMLAASLRSEDKETSELAVSLRSGGDETVRRIELEPLPGEDARELMRQLNPSDPAGSVEFVEEAQGSPFFVSELAHYLREHAPTPDRAVDLASIVLRRLDAMPEDAREIVETVSVSRRPLDLAVALDVSGVGKGGVPRIYELCGRSLLRTSGSGREIDVYHARIRDAVVDRMSPERLRRRHRALAEALAGTENPPASAVLEHFLEAEDIALAALWSTRAAAEAERALAFDRAAELYTLAWSLNGEVSDQFVLLERRAEALAAGGRGAEAALAFAETADAASQAGAPVAQMATLRVRAAAQHFYSGALEMGTAELRGVLGELEIPLPSSPERALASAAWSFLRFALRGPEFRARPAEEVDPEALLRLDALEGVARGTSMLDHNLSSAIHGRTLLAALELGEPSRVMRALALEAGVEANIGGAWLRRRSLRLVERIEVLAAETEDPYDAAWAASTRSAVAWFHGRWRDCVDASDDAVRLLRDGCLGTTWELATNQSFTASALVQLGELERLAQWLPEQRDAARERNDAYGMVIHRTGDSVMVALLEDRGQDALDDLAASGTAYREGALHSLHFQHLVGYATTLLYLGRAADASAAMEYAWPALQKSGLLRLDCIGNGLRHLRARTAIARACEVSVDADERRNLLRVAAHEAQLVKKSGLRHNAANAAAIRGGVAAAHGDSARALRELDLAQRVYGETEMRLYAHAARWRAGALTGGDEGSAREREAVAWLETQGAVRPEALLAMSVALGSVD